MISIQLARLLGERKLFQSDLSRMTGIRPNTISDLFHGVVNRVSLDHLDRICEALDCSLTDLLCLTPNEQNKAGKHLIVEECRRKKPRNTD